MTHAHRHGARGTPRAVGALAHQLYHSRICSHGGARMTHHFACGARGATSRGSQIKSRDELTRVGLELAPDACHPPRDHRAPKRPSAHDTPSETKAVVSSLPVKSHRYIYIYNYIYALAAPPAVVCDSSGSSRGSSPTASHLTARPPLLPSRPLPSPPVPSRPLPR